MGLEEREQGERRVRGGGIGRAHPSPSFSSSTHGSRCPSSGAMASTMAQAVPRRHQGRHKRRAPAPVSKVGADGADDHGRLATRALVLWLSACS